jgi:hypothetical protein
MIEFIVFNKRKRKHYAAVRSGNFNIITGYASLSERGPERKK